MKKYILAGLVALVALLVIPMAVSATDTVSVSGTVPVTISIDVAPTSWNFGTMNVIPLVNTAGPSTVSVTTSSISWHVDATSLGGSGPGYMYNSSRAKTLGAAFNMSNIALSGPYNQTTTLWSNFMAGGAAGYYSSPVYVQQLVSPVDTEGIYSVVATFTTYAN